MEIFRTAPQKVADFLLGVKPTPLNTEFDDPPAPDSQNLIVNLKKFTDEFKTQALDQATGRVDYRGLRDSEVYQTCRMISAGLQNFDPLTLDNHKQKLAFWINLYNVLIIDAIILMGVKESIQEIRGVFRKVGYNVGGIFYNADDIEHGILRANAGNPAIPGPQFAQNDPRRAFMVTQLDPRIHFALVCGADSCPPVSIYDADKLDLQLTLAARNFINGSDVEIDLQNKTAQLSKILSWYASDFGGSVLNSLGLGSKANLLKSIAQYIVDDETRSAIENDPNAFKVSFKTYNWHLNAVSA